RLLPSSYERRRTGRGNARHPAHVARAAGTRGKNDRTVCEGPELRFIGHRIHGPLPRLRPHLGRDFAKLGPARSLFGLGREVTELHRVQARSCAIFHSSSGTISKSGCAIACFSRAVSWALRRPITHDRSTLN